MSEKADDVNSNENGSMIKIDPDTFIHSNSILRGRVTFDAGCVVHPHASIDAGDGEIVIGL